MQSVFYIILLILLARPLGLWIAAVGNNENHFLKRILGNLETTSYRLSGIAPEKEMTWPIYLLCVVIFNAIGLIALLVILLLQSYLPLNPQKVSNLSFPLAFNTAVSFVTNTNWQAYSGEAALSYFSQAFGLTVQNFLSAATGIAVFFALARGIASRGVQTLGNFWADLTRVTLYLLLPLSFIFAVFLVSQGVVQTFSPYKEIKTIESSIQTVPLGPVASQVAIKQLGTNGGGYFGTNSAHPFENPTPLSNFLEALAILLIPASLPFAFGKMIARPRDGLALFFAMLLLLITSLCISLYFENLLPIKMEGKEVRFGTEASVLWSVVTTAASSGSVNAMHSSLSPLSGLVTLFNMMLGEVIFGGVGSGLYGMLLFVVVTVFIAGLMVGRSPEYQGKKVERTEVVWALTGILLPCLVVLLGSALSVISTAGLESKSATGPHGLTEIVYAWTSAANNNGSAFAGLNANTSFYNIGLAFAMIIGRFGVIIPALAIAGSLSKKKITPPSPGTFPTDSFTFILLLVATIVIVGGLTFIPILTLGPIAEHMSARSGLLF